MGWVGEEEGDGEGWVYLQFVVQYNFVVSEKLKATSYITKRADRLDVGQRITLPARLTVYRTLTVKFGE